MPIKLSILMLLVFCLLGCNPEKEGENNNTPIPISETLKLNNTERYEINTFTNDSVVLLFNRDGQEIKTGTSQPYSFELITDNFQPSSELPLGAPSSSLLSNPKASELSHLDPIPSDFEKDFENPFYEIEAPVELIGETKKSSSPVPTKALFPRHKDQAYKNILVLDVDQGLPTSYVYTLLKDQDDNIWFGNWGGGLTRYNGYSFTNYTTENGLSSNTIMCLLQDQNENIWIGTRKGGLNKFDGETFTSFNQSNGLKSNIIKSLFEDDKGNLWIGYDKGGASKIENNSITHYLQKDLDSQITVDAINQDEFGNIWFGTSEGMYILKEDKLSAFKKENELSKQHINCLFNSYDQMWIGTKQGAYLYENTTLTDYSTTYGLNHTSVKAICKDSENNIVIGSDGGGISIIKENFVDHLSIENGLGSDGILDLMLDKSGNVWAGTFGGGVSLIKKMQINHYDQRTGLSTNFIRSIDEDYKNDLWYASDGGGLIHFDGKAFNEYRASSGVQSNIIMTLLAASDSSIWFSPLGEGICNLKNGRISKYNIDNGLSSNNVSTFYEDEFSRIWVGTEDNGVNIIDQNQLFHLSEEQGLSSNYVISIFQDSKNKMWLSTEKSGICMLDEELITIYSEKEGLSNNSLRTVREDKDGTIWIGSKTGGLNSIIGDSIKKYGIINGLPSNTIQSLEFYNDNLWGSSENGVFCLEPSGNIRSYQKQDGLKGLDHYVESSCLTEDGKIWWGSGKCLTSLDIPISLESDDPLKTNLNNLEINGSYFDFNNLDDSLKKFIQLTACEKFYNVPQGLELSPVYNHLTFHFNASNWQEQHAVFYSYKIEELGESWSQKSPESKAEYRNLPAGTFTFKVRSIDKNGQWSKTEKFTFTIRPPWWESSLAYILYISFTILVIYFIIRLRTNQLKKRQKELQSEVKIATEEIRAQKDKIEYAHLETQKQKSIIETAHDEIKDSINYAKRIQTAILPPPKLVKKHLKQSFILYEPKDIVAGDFYWMEPNENGVLFAAADCTGHGVPGAMVSVICNNGLNRSVREFGLTEPGEILDKTRNIVIQEFEKSEEEVKDGMDIAICSLQGSKLKYAGAHNPLWIIRKNANEIEEIKADKQPIGQFVKASAFSTHEITLNEGDTVYIFSDGFADQFGGDKGKKYKSKNFKTLLLSMQNENMDRQKVLIEKAFENWKGNLEQLDDVCVIGVRV